jgi:predicted RNA methylase
MFLPHLKNRVQEPAVVVSAPFESTAKPATVTEPAPIVATDPPRRDFSEPVPGIFQTPDAFHRYRFRATSNGSESFGKCDCCHVERGGEYWHSVTLTKRWSADGSEFWGETARRLVCFRCAGNLQNGLIPNVEPAAEPAPEPEQSTEESGFSLPPSVDFSDENDTIEDFTGKEHAAVAFGKELEANRSAVIQGWTYRIEPQQDRNGFQIVITSPDGFSETICSGFYGFAFDTFDRTVGYAVSKARGRFVCHPETFQNGCQIEKRYHNRRAVFVYVVTLPDPVKGSKFEKLETQAKRFGGWYAREYRPEYQRGGFMFTDKRQADRFAKDFTPSVKVATMRHNATTEPAPANQETPSGDFSDVEPSTEYAQRISRNVDHIARMSTAARLEELANGMQKTIDEKTRPMSQNWTAKRGREYNSRCHDGRHLQRVQEALRVLAAHWRAGTVPDSMRELKAKSAILPLLSCHWDSCNDRGTDDFRNTSPLAVELRELIELNRSGETREQLAAAKRAADIKAAEDNLRLRNVPGFFPTPPALVDRMVEQAQFPQSPSEDFSVLEPSAGIGSIADGIASEIPPDRIKCVEISSACCSVLELKGYNVGEGDFLQIPAGERFDRILMNPPFENGQDIDHVRHAFSLLKSGGRLVAIMSEGSFTTTKRKAVEFVEWIDSQCAEYETIRGAFDNLTAFRSTGVTVRLVTIDKD